MARKKKDNTEDNESFKKSSVIGPYDIINMIFTNYEEFNKLTNAILDKNFFIINRVFSIKYPLQAVLFNKTTINTASTIKAWAAFAVSKEGYGRVPYFVYTKGTKKSTSTSSKIKDITTDKNLVKEYCKRYGITLKDFSSIKSFFYDELINDMKRYEKIISIKEQEKNISK